ncbi:hypothetical protein LIER_22048 [Lithospermum erythrorhizon]|uniref:Myb/SANT-like domain-containing protein n=1 Tax=Lithospermum erythrorhizon TaxID=34254 RepID=A0AAV3QY35_LITER
MAGRATRWKKPISQAPKVVPSRAKWTTSLTKVLVDLMVDQVTKGDNPRRFLTKKAWKVICSGFYKKTGLNWDVDQLKSRHAILRRQYLSVNALLSSKNFTFDQSKGSIVAKKALWEKYIEEHPDAETLKTNGFPFYKQVCRLFSETASCSKTPELKETATASIVCINSSQNKVSSSEPEEVKRIDEKVKKEPGCSADVTPKRGRQGMNGLIAKGIMEMALASKLTAVAITRCNEKFSIANSVKALDELQGINEEEYYAALDLLDNYNAREIFLSLKADKRLAWLRNKCLA